MKYWAFLNIFVFMGALQADPIFEAPNEWQNYLALERYGNTGYFEGIKVGGSVQTLYYWDIPLKQLRKKGFRELGSVSPTYRDRLLKEKILTTGRSDATIRIFALDEPGFHFDILKSELGEPRSDLFALKISGKDSYFCWGKTKSAFGLKFVRTGDGDTGNSVDWAHLAIKMNDYLVSNFLNLGTEDGSVSFLPEIFNLVLVFKNFHFAYTVRLFQPFQRKIEKNEILLPLHGFLGSPEWIKKMADLTGLKPEEWIENEYLTKLAAFYSKINYNHGIFPASHTQNLNIILDLETGRINSFLVKDLQDIAVHDLIPISRFPYAPITFLKGTSSKQMSDRRFYENYPGSDVENGEYPGIYISEFLGQSAFMFRQFPELQRKLAYHFLLTYIRETEFLIGQPLMNDQEILNSLSLLTVTTFLGKKWTRERVMEVFRSVTELLFKSVGRKILDNKTKDHVAYTYQAVGHAWSNARFYMRAYYLAGGKQTETPLIMNYNGRTIIGLHYQTQEPWTYAYALTEKEKKMLRKGRHYWNYSAQENLQFSSLPQVVLRRFLFLNFLKENIVMFPEFSRRYRGDMEDYLDDTQHKIYAFDGKRVAELDPRTYRPILLAQLSQKDISRLKKDLSVHDDCRNGLEHLTRVR